MLIYAYKYIFISLMKSLEERQKELKKFEDSLKVKIEEKKLDELEKLEQELIAEADKQGEELGKLEFDMPTENYETVATAVRKFLNKQSVQWQYTLGMVAMYDFWDPKAQHKTIPYPHLDSILRNLGNLQFTGYEEWAAVVAVNKFFEPLQKAYMDATQETYDIASRHDAVIRAIEKVQMDTPIGNGEDTKA